VLVAVPITVVIKTFLTVQQSKLYPHQPTLSEALSTINHTDEATF